MQYEWPFVIADKEVEQALQIVVNYFERKHGVLPPNTVENALAALYGLFRKENVRNPLLLGNKVIDQFEHQPAKSRAA